MQMLKILVKSHLYVSFVYVCAFGVMCKIITKSQVHEGLLFFFFSHKFYVVFSSYIWVLIYVELIFVYGVVGVSFIFVHVTLQFS